MTSDFVVIPELFYNAQQDIISAETIMKQKRNSINACKSSIPESYEYKSEIFDICENLSQIIISVSRLERNVSEAKDRLISLDSAFAAEYYQCASNKYNDMVGPLSQEQLSYSQYTSDKYNRSLFKYLSELKSKGLLTPELESVYNQLEISLDLQSLEDELSKLDVNSDEYQNKYKDYNNKLQDLMNIQIKELESKESLSEEEQEQLKSLKDNLSLNELESELEELIKNPVMSPGIASSRMSESDAKKYQEQAKKYGEYEKKKNELESKIKDIQKSLGTYKNKWYEDIGEAIVKTGSAWKTAWQTKSVNDALSATKQTLATGAVVYTSAKSGVAKIGELVVDGVALAGGSIVSGLTWLGNHDAGKNLMDGTLDFVRRDLVGEVNKNFYENNSIGKWINENSNLKYDSAGAQAIQNADEFVGKVALATAATVVSGGAVAPIVIGALYGAGNAGEKYTQSVDRNNGESYNYGKALLRTTAGAVAGAAEFYGYGQMGAGMLGVNISPQASTSFVKNFLTKDTLLDSVSVVTDHGVNVAFGDETWQHALLYGGAEFALALGMNAIGARQSTKAARAAEASKDIYSHSDPEITEKIMEINEKNYSRNASKFTSKKDYYDAQAYVAKNNYWYKDTDGKWQHKVLDKNDPGLSVCYTKKYKKEWKRTIDNYTVNGITKTNNYNTNVDGFINNVLGQPNKPYGTFGYKGNYNFASPGSITESLGSIRKIEGENFINTMAINRGTDCSNAKRIIFTEVDVPRSSISMHTGKELGSNVQRLPGALPDNSVELVYETLIIDDIVADSTRVIIKNENGKILFDNSLSKLKKIQNNDRQFFNMLMGIISE